MTEILNTVCESALACAKCVKDEVCGYWDSLDENTVVNKQDLVLGAAALVAAGMLIGKMCASKKTIVINAPVEDEDEEEDEVQ